jgi:flagellar hook assembly protein FlgD
MIKPSNISLIIYDVLGREIYKLIDNEEFNTGEHNMVWDGTKENGNKAASGIYFYSLISEQQVLTRSMILLK